MAKNVKRKKLGSISVGNKFCLLFLCFLLLANSTFADGGNYTNNSITDAFLNTFGLSQENALDLISAIPAGLFLLMLFFGVYFVYLLATKGFGTRTTIVGDILLVLFLVFAANSQVFA